MAIEVFYTEQWLALLNGEPALVTARHLAPRAPRPCCAGWRVFRRESFGTKIYLAFDMGELPSQAGASFAFHTKPLAPVVSDNRARIGGGKRNFRSEIYHLACPCVA
jgi:hypothetical protein